MSQVPVEGVDLFDNLPYPEAVSAQTRNLNDTNTLPQGQSLSPSHNEEGGVRMLAPKKSFNYNGKDGVGEQAKEGHAGRGEEEEEEEEDIDNVMKEEDEDGEEESEDSNSLIGCQSPDTPMTDSSYSESGSLLETQYPFSPGTSPEPTSPVIPMTRPETAYPFTPVEFNQCDVKMDSDVSDTGSVAFTTGPIQSATLTATSGARPATTCFTQDTDRIAKKTDSATELLTSSTEPLLNRGPATSHAGLITSTTETCTVTAGTTTFNTSISSTSSATTGPLASNTAPASTGTASTSTATPETSNLGPMTTAPTSFPVSTCPAGTIPKPAVLESLEHLAQRGDDTHLPHYLHQIAEAFVLNKDYQRALWCIQLERLYHQRVLENLSTLQEQWESQCKRTSSDLSTQHLDTLRQICQTHRRPRARDDVCASLDFVRPPVEDAGALPLCPTAHQVDRATDSSCSLSQSSDPVVTSIVSADRLSCPEISDKGREDLDKELDELGGFRGSQLTDRRASEREGGEAGGGVGHAISATGNELHPSTAGEMDQSEPAELQGGDLGRAQGEEAKREEETRDVEEATEAAEMEEEGEEEEKEKQKERDSVFCQEALPVDNLISGAAEELEQLHQEAPAEEKLHRDTEDSTKTRQQPEGHLAQEVREEEQEEEEEEVYEYEVEQADIIREAASLDDMAKLITIEEKSPASGLVSILKKKGLCVSSGSETQPSKAAAKRRVHFKVPEDDEQDVGGGDSCLLLFLLCLVTVVISMGGTALYCALGDAHSTVCQDFSRNADFYIGQIQHGIAHIQHWFSPGS